MIAEIHIVPVGIGDSLSTQVARVLELIDASGLAYKTNPMGTAIEGPWDDVMRLIKTCHEDALKSSPRVLTTITIDDRPGHPGGLDEKVHSVERKLGKTLRT